MKFNQLGKSELYISEISLGGMSLKADNPEKKQILHRALDLGINFFDTADLYEKGENEKLFGDVFTNMRKDVIIASKVGNQWRPDGSGWDWNPRKEYIIEAVEDSLKRLRTDYIDLYQLHGGIIDDPMDETIEAFETLLEQGKIRYYGISSIRLNVIRHWLEASNISSLMSQYSLLDRRPEEETHRLIGEKGVGMLVRGAVAQGLLAGKPAREYLKHSSSTVSQLLLELRAKLSEEESLAQLAIRYALHPSEVATVVAGASSVGQLEENVAASNFEPFKRRRSKGITESESPDLLSYPSLRAFLEAFSQFENHFFI